jgi:hypothetical protein
MGNIKRAGASLALVSFTVLAIAPALGQGTDAQREACTPDAFRLCSAAMPDASRVESCLRAAGPRLSAPCYAVFNPPQQADRMRDRRFDRRDAYRSDDRYQNDRYEDRYGREPSRRDRMRSQDDDED